jgi:flagellar motor switch protein FliM
MEPILNKAEISELLTAIKDGRVSLDLDEQEQAQVLECTPINIFQLSRPDSEQFRVPNFDIILDTFCRYYSTSLTNQLQLNFSISRTSLETYEFQKFMAEKCRPGAIGILDLQPLKHGALIIFDSKISFSLIEIMLGASAEIESLQLNRWLTTIELNVLKTIIADACRDLDKSFSTLIDLQSSLIKLENNARLVSIVEPEAEIIVGTFLVKVGEYAGEVHLVFPFVTLEPLREKLKELTNIATKTTSSWYDLLSDEVMEVAATITAQSGTIQLTIREMLSLEEGDILRLDYDPNTPLKVLVADKYKFYAIPGTHNGMKAISITGEIT